MYDLVVVGGGVAGLFAAGSTAQRGLKVCLLEKMEKPARKLRITGKGRCNITNTKPREEFLGKIHSGAEFITQAYDGFTNLQAIEFFNTIGIETIRERGDRVFPTSGSAVDVALAMVSWCQVEGVEIACHSKVEEIRKIGENFEVNIEGQPMIVARNILLATGGVSYPSTGSTGDGHYFAHQFGHEIEPLLPSLVALQIAQKIDDIALKNTKVSLVVNGEIVDERFGDVDFSSRGIAGAATLQLSRRAVEELSSSAEVDLELDLKPALTITKLSNRLKREIEAQPDRITVKELLRKILPREMVSITQSQIPLSGKKRLADMPPQEREKAVEIIAQVVKAIRLEVVDYGAFSQAIVTNGGVSLNEVDPKSMESTIVKGLYFAGELLDLDADTGGYNIQIALSTAHLAAQSISRAISQSK